MCTVSTIVALKGSSVKQIRKAISKEWFFAFNLDLILWFENILYEGPVCESEKTNHLQSQPSHIISHIYTPTSPKDLKV